MFTAASTLSCRSIFCAFALSASMLAACAVDAGAGDATEPPAAVEQDVTAKAPARPIGNPAQGIMEGSCSVGADVWCASQVYGCLPVCVDSRSSACHICIDATFTAGVDCWSCLFGGGSSGGGIVPPSPYYGCKYFPGDPDATGNPRIHTSGGKIGEECMPSVYNIKTRSWQRECCLYRAR